MKSRKNLIAQLNSLPHFTKGVICQLGEVYGLKTATIDTYISRYLKSKEIIRLKNGLYISAEFLAKNKNDASYAFYLANILRTPSYVSSWTALQYYNLATEAIHTVSSITLKNTRAYETKARTFSYQSISKKLFSGFSLIKGDPASLSGRFDFFIASPAKALFDLLYFKTHQFRGVRLEDVGALVEELRVDIDEMDKKEQEIFFNMTKKYLRYD